ncbi:MAG TPA: hypothetical protein VN851_15190 [Thermoanaerobaculia bacterium]|nr:hypothetical protein [Thermoanaerobaculia bacterium]
MLVYRGECATKGGDHANAALYFERAAVAYESIGEPLPAAEATLELGRCALYLQHGEWLPALAGRLVNLAREEAKALPEGGLITMRVWAAILRRGEIEPAPFLHLIRVRRRVRRALSGAAFWGQEVVS